jgi:hypothetical protein
VRVLVLASEGVSEFEVTDGGLGQGGVWHGGRGVRAVVGRVKGHVVAGREQR